MRTDRMPSGVPRREYFPTNIIPEPMMQLTERHMGYKVKSRMEDEGSTQDPPAQPPAVVLSSPIPAEAIQTVPDSPASDPQQTIAQADGY